MEDILELVDRKRVNKAISELENKLNILKQFRDRKDLSNVTIELVYHNKDTFTGQYYAEDDYDMKCEFAYNDNWKNILMAFQRIIYNYTIGYFVSFKIKVGSIIVYETSKREEFEKIMDTAITRDTSIILGLISDYFDINKKISKCKSNVEYIMRKFASFQKLKKKCQPKKLIKVYKQDLEKSKKDLKEYQHRISEIRKELLKYGIDIEEMKEAIKYGC